MPRSRTSFGTEPDDAIGSRRALAETDLDITPMIDVTFLLLIFFMVTSTMKPPSEVDVPPAEYGKGLDNKNATPIVIRAPKSEGDSPVIVFEDGREGSLDQVESVVLAAFQEKGTAQVLVKADREVPHGFIQQVLKEVDSVEGVQFFIEVQDK